MADLFDAELSLRVKTADRLPAVGDRITFRLRDERYQYRVAVVHEDGDYCDLGLTIEEATDAG